MEVFTDTVTIQDSALTTLVGEGKKFKTVDDLAKSKLEADNFIETLKAEIAEAKAERDRLATESATRKSVEDQIRALEANRAVKTENEPTARVEVPGDLNQRIKAELESVQRSQVIEGNVRTVSDKLVELYGSEEKARDAVKGFATELGVSTKFLMDAAAASPNAFFNTVGIADKVKTVNPGVTKTEVNSEAFRHTTPSTHPVGSYEQMRDTMAGRDVNKLLSPAYLAATMDAALKDPDRFFANQ